MSEDRIPAAAAIELISKTCSIMKIVYEMKMDVKKIMYSVLRLLKCTFS